MRDCANGEVRDRLPELVHGRLDGPERGAVEAHVAECPDCASEVALIRLVAGSAALAVPRVDVRKIAAALPGRADASAGSGAGYARRPWMRWAAGFVIAAAGIGAVQFAVRDDARNVALGDRELPAANGERAVARPVADPAGTYSRGGLVLVGGIDALTIDELEALVLGVETLSSMPEPVPFTVGDGLR
jgi:anti-sigma factor RsiW